MAQSSSEKEPTFTPMHTGPLPKHIGGIFSSRSDHKCHCHDGFLGKSGECCYLNFRTYPDKLNRILVIRVILCNCQYGCADKDYDSDSCGTIAEGGPWLDEYCSFECFLRKHLFVTPYHNMFYANTTLKEPTIRLTADNYFDDKETIDALAEIEKIIGYDFNAIVEEYVDNVNDCHFDNTYRCDDFNNDSEDDSTHDDSEEARAGQNQRWPLLAGSDSLGWSYGASGDATELINEDTLARDQIAQRNTESAQQLLEEDDGTTN